MTESRRVGLALSGGGVRAMAFHSGVMRWMAEGHQLEKIVHVSTVSGGSLFIGLLFKFSNWCWPTSEQYFSAVQKEIKKVLTETDLLKSAVMRLLLPGNWRFLLSRANVVSQTIKNCWGISERLSDLPEIPVWSVNGTTAETGRRFRFKRNGCGDYEIGYADASQFKVSDAMAVSAAFPVGIGPFAIKTDEFVWYKRESWDSPPDAVEKVNPPFDALHIYDGGIYDNLGLEPLFDIGKQQLKDGINHIIVSDAGALLKRGSLGWALNPFRTKRIADIALDQTRALRVRSFINFIKTNPSSGKYLQLGTDALSQITKFRAHNEEAAQRLLTDSWLDGNEVQIAAGHRTTLRRLSEQEFDRLERHGYETARWNELLLTPAS